MPRRLVEFQATRRVLAVFDVEKCPAHILAYHSELALDPCSRVHFFIYFYSFFFPTVGWPRITARHSSCPPPCLPSLLLLLL